MDDGSSQRSDSEKHSLRSGSQMSGKIGDQASPKQVQTDTVKRNDQQSPSRVSDIAKSLSPSPSPNVRMSKEQRRIERERQATKYAVKIVIEKAKQKHERQQTQKSLEKKQKRSISLNEANAIANRLNDELKPIQFIGSKINISQHFPKQSSTYVDQIKQGKINTNTKKFTDEPSIVKTGNVTLEHKETTVTPENKQDFPDLTSGSAMQIRNSLATSFDTTDMKMISQNSQCDPDNAEKIGNFREKIHFHDLIMLTDIYSIPQLLTILSQSQLSEEEIESRILK